MPFIVPGICRFGMHATFAGANVVNILDMRIDTTGSSMSRPDAIEAQAGVLLNEWKDSFLPRLTNGYSFNSVSWLDLNSPTGSVGSRITAGGVTLPAIGANVFQQLPGNTSALIHKNITGTRGARRGRMYVCGISEDDTDSAAPNVLKTSSMTPWTTALNSFISDISQESDFTSYSSNPVVVQVLTYAPPEPPHTTPSPATGTSHQVTSFTIDQRLATQRRRLRS